MVLPSSSQKHSTKDLSGIADPLKMALSNGVTELIPEAHIESVQSVTPFKITDPQPVRRLSAAGIGNISTVPAHTSLLHKSNTRRLRLAPCWLDQGVTVEDIINTQYPPSERDINQSRIVDRVVELVQNSMIGSPHDLPPNRVLVVILVIRREYVLDYAEATRLGTCSICMEGFQVGRDGSRLPCLHSFHGRCIFNWLHRKHHCPICRPVSSTCSMDYMVLIKESGI